MAIKKKTTRKTPARARRTLSKSRAWDKLITALPGYDPNADAAGFSFRADLAERVCQFFETQLFIIEGKDAGKPFKLLDWQAAFLGNLFGWVDSAGLRRYREALLYIPKKNGKSPLAGGLLDYVLLCDGEAGAQCYCAAADRDQAGIVYRHARGMLERNPELENVVTIYNSFKSINFMESFAKVISAEAARKHGYNSHLVIIDELHAQPDRELVDVLSNSISSRLQPLVIHITTADFDRPSICNEKFDYAKKVAAGVIKDPRFLPVLYYLDADADWQDPANWAKVNPSLGITKTLDYMTREADRARNEPSYRATFRRLELNQVTKTENVWIDLAQWDAAARAWTDAEVMPLKCWGACDLATTTDIAALSLAWPLPGGLYALKNWYWIPENAAREKEKRDRVPYALWREQGLIEFTPGDVIDYDHIRARIIEIADNYALQDLAFDPWNAQQLAMQLQAQDGITVVEFRQGFKTMSPAAKAFEKLIIEKKLLHNGDPILRWMAGNAAVVSDPAGNIKPVKDAKSNKRIDGIISGIMAVGRAMVQTVATPANIYETRGLRRL